MSDDVRTAVTYRPGQWVGISGGNVGVLLCAELDHPLVVPLHERVAAGGGVDDLLEAILAEGLRTTSAFALAERHGSQIRVLVRGDAIADVADGSGGNTRVRSETGMWADRRLEGSGVLLRSFTSDPTGPTLPLRSGIAQASALCLGQVGTSVPTVAEASPAAAPPAEGEGVTDPADEAGHETTALASLPQIVEEEIVGDPDDAFDDLLKHTLLERPRPRPAQAPSAPSADPPAAPTPTTGLDGIRSPIGSEVDGRTLGPDEWPEMVALPALSAEPPLVDHRIVPPPPAGPNIIDAMPDFGDWNDAVGLPAPGPRPTQALPPSPAPVSYLQQAGPTPSAAQPPARVASLPPRSTHAARPDLTVNRSMLVGSGGAARAMAPEVQAGRCPQGHLSPAHAAVCRVCGVPLPPQNAVWVPRPILGRLVFSNGDIVTLDRGLVLGRSPSLPAGHNGEQPNLVKLNDPTLEVSSQHLEVRLDHWYVLVLDLGSTNGTLVTLPGQQPLRLRPGTPQPIEPGTVVNLADVLTFVFEVTA